jgi:threonine/homoserine/homoserine lactone efflux protein
LSFLLKGLLIGFCIAAPVGPIGVLCIRRSLAHGFATGLATGLGAAAADAMYGCIAGFGLTAISMFLVGQQMWLGIIGGVFLIYLGIRTFVARPNDQSAEVKTMGLLSCFGSTLFLTLTNPMTIISFAAVFAGFGLGTSPSYGAATALVAGVFIGSAAWWVILSGGVSAFRSRLSPAAMGWTNRFSGLLILGFGIYALLRPVLASSNQ